jgi:hypothetical protein
MEVGTFLAKYLDLPSPINWALMPFLGHDLPAKMTFLTSVSYPIETTHS